VFEAIPNAKVRGLTGTAFRADGTGSLEKTFGPIIFRYSFLDALQDGYVKPLIPAYSDAKAEINTEGLKTVGEDYDLEEQASRAIALSPVHSKAIVQTMQRQKRNSILVFACNIAHADVLEEKLNALGVEAASVHSHSPKGKREKMVARFRARNLPILISVAMFDTGFNAVDIDMLAYCRATKSPVFFAQSLGRGARITPYAQNCAVLDFGGNVARHGSIDAIAAAPGTVLFCEELECNQSWETWKHGRTCPKCEVVHRTATKCKGCKDRFDQFYHGAVCPHCGLRQTTVKACAACEGIYATWLHPICPHCGYDNTNTQKPGKDLSETGATNELVNVSEIIKTQPWQEVLGTPFDSGNGNWHLETRYAVVKWPFKILPDIVSVYLLKTANGRIVIKGWYDKTGKVNQI
jgi:superfamily II DNA or RNA helicase